MAYSYSLRAAGNLPKLFNIVPYLKRAFPFSQAFSANSGFIYNFYYFSFFIFFTTFSSSLTFCTPSSNKLFSYSVIDWSYFPSLANNEALRAKTLPLFE